MYGRVSFLCWLVVCIGCSWFIDVDGYEFRAMDAMLPVVPGLRAPDLDGGNSPPPGPERPCVDGGCPACGDHHECDGGCVSDFAVASCGDACQPCPLGPIGSEPACVSTAQGMTCDFVCIDGFHRCGDRCAADDSPESCGEGCQPCPVPPNGVATCDGSVCGIECMDGFHQCGDRCVPNNSTDTCGTRCQACAVPSNGVATCDGSSCGVKCAATFDACGSICCSSATVCVRPRFGGQVLTFAFCLPRPPVEEPEFIVPPQFRHTVPQPWPPRWRVADR